MFWMESLDLDFWQLFPSALSDTSHTNECHVFRNRKQSVKMVRVPRLWLYSTQKLLKKSEYSIVAMYLCQIHTLGYCQGFSFRSFCVEFALNIFWQLEGRMLYFRTNTLSQLVCTCTTVSSELQTGGFIISRVSKNRLCKASEDVQTWMFCYFKLNLGSNGT